MISAHELIDRTDARLLEVLSRKGRASYEELGQAVGLSASATLRRVKRLEEAGVITGYSAVVNPHRLGPLLTAYVQVRMVKQAPGERRSPLETFAAAVNGWPEVAECVSLTGEMDCLLHLQVPDMDAFSRFVMERLLRHPSVQDCKSSFVLKPLKAPRAGWHQAPRPAAAPARTGRAGGASRIKSPGAA